MTPQIDRLTKMSTVLRVSTHIYGVFKGDRWENMFIFRVNLGMWPLKSIVSEKQALFWGFQHTSYGVSQGDRWENIHLESKPKHMIPQIDRLGKTSTVLRVSTHIFEFCKEIDGKTFIFRVNLGMWPLKSIILEKWSIVLRVSAHIFEFFKEIDGKMFILRVNLGIWHLKSIVLEKRALFWGFQHKFMGFFQGHRWETIHFSE